jgi:shikimate kinase
LLVGFMGCGKSVVGQEIARQLRWQFIDLDEQIEAAQGRTISEIFELEGEHAFRQAETEVLRRMLATFRAQKCVIALGGGTFVQETNLRQIKAATGSVAVFLDAPVTELRRRAAKKTGSRPLFKDENHFRQLFESRVSGYMQADMRVDTAGRSIAEIAAEIIARLDLR